MSAVTPAESLKLAGDSLETALAHIEHARPGVPKYHIDAMRFLAADLEHASISVRNISAMLKALA